MHVTFDRRFRAECGTDTTMTLIILYLVYTKVLTVVSDLTRIWEREGVCENSSQRPRPREASDGTPYPKKVVKLPAA